MNNLALALSISNLALGLTLINTPIVKAASINYDFQVNIDSGNLLGNSFNGSFSFDDTSLTNTGDEFIPLDSIDFNFQGTNYTDVMTPIAEATFLDGDFLGLSYSPDDSLAFIPGFFDINETSFAYDLTDAGTGLGDVVYTETTPVTPPTPKTTPESSFVVSLFSLVFFGLTFLKKQKRAL